QHGHTSIVLQLIDAEYPTIFATANFKRILQSSSHSEDLASLAQVFLERRPELLSYRVFQWSAERNQRALLRLLFSLITERDVGSVVNFVKSVQVVVTTASKLGYLGLLKWVHLNISRAPMSPWPSARHGHVHILNWLHANGILDEPKLDAAIRTSVRFGHLEVLQ
ncbi:Aste57867_14580, partial [Globisporangium polare]